MRPVPDLDAVFRETKARLEQAGIESAGREAGLLLCDVLGIALEGLLLWRRQAFDETLRPGLEERIIRRVEGEPVQYILGTWEFMGLEFEVAPVALIPRQDTETLVEHALELQKEKGYATALDLGCGTGCIGISMAVLGRNFRVLLSDISPACVDLARRNAEKHHVTDRVEFVVGDLFEPVANRRFDMILSNPPYLADGEMETLQREVGWEPALALAGGADGLEFYRRIAAGYREHLNPGGVLLLELGWTQAKAGRELFSVPTLLLEDLNHIPRVLLAMG